MNKKIFISIIIIIVIVVLLGVQIYIIKNKNTSRNMLVTHIPGGVFYRALFNL